MEFKNLKKSLEEFTKEVAEMYKKKLIEDGKKATGELINSIKSAPIEINGNIYTFGIKVQDYWKYVEYGSKPHFPPVDALITWIEKKPVHPKDGLVKNNRQLAYLIGRKIERDGIEAGNQLATTLEELKTKWDKVFEEAVTKDIVEELDKIFVNF